MSTENNLNENLPVAQFDILSIGDIVIDAFIRLEDAEATCDLDQANCKLCVRFGDKVPFQSVDVLYAVGNSPNASVSAARLGLKSALMAHVGQDLNGQECIKALQGNGVDTRFVNQDAGFDTNYHYVLWYDVERTILVKHAEFPYKMPSDVLLAKPKWIYLSSMAKNSVPYHHEIATYLKRNPEVKLAFQPGTFQMMLGTEQLADVYSETDIFFCNDEEAQRILKTDEKDIRKLAEGIQKFGPKVVVITLGVKGAYALDGTDFWFMPIYPQDAFERTGAGDAFSSTFVAAIALGKTVQEALSWAPINSMSVVQYVGAQKGLLTREKLEEYLRNAPADYKPVKI